jgi:sec-independent protein translocase protein TatC
MSQSDTVDDTVEDSAAPLIEHLKELRYRILVSIATFAGTFLLGYLIWDKIFNILSIPMCTALEARGQECQFILVKLQEGFFVAIKIAMWGGFAMAFPIIAFQLWRFVAPGLYRNEKAAFLPFLLASPIMFIVGATFAYFIILPFAFSFFLGFEDVFKAAMEGSSLATAPAGVVYQGSVEAYLSLTMTFVMAFGLCFQLPVLLTLLGKAGILTAAGLKATRKYAIVAILFVAAVVTPPDVMSQLILFAAVYPLYEISIFLITRFERQREAEERANGTWVDEDVTADD